MGISLQMAVMLIPGVLRFGALRLPVYGLFAAVGLVAALWLSQRTARLAGVDTDKLWDAGVFAIVAAFVASRVLLVVVDLPAFLRFPMLVLSLPSLTYGGMVLTGVLVWAWLRWKRLPMLRVLDAWAPCACVLAAVLSLGHFVEGTDAGMPTSLPWGVVTPGDTVLGKVHPVQLYGVLAALGLGWWLLRRLKRDEAAGRVAAFAMICGGAIAFLLDMVRQPADAMAAGWMDPGQIVALVVMLVGGWLFVMPESVAIRTPGSESPDPYSNEQVRSSGTPDPGHPAVVEHMRQESLKELS
jgi:phosphatidylglycerol---prolipoprotein diacylglyceryl transferase